MSDTSDWSQIGKINFTFLRACACGGIAWLCLKGYETGVDWLLWIAAMYLGGAAFYAVIAIYKTIKVILGTMRWSRFRKGHAAPKSDPMAGEKDLRAKGILK